MIFQHLIWYVKRDLRFKLRDSIFIAGGILSEVFQFFNQKMYPASFSGQNKSLDKSFFEGCYLLKDGASPTLSCGKCSTVYKMFFQLNYQHNLLDVPEILPSFKHFPHSRKMSSSSFYQDKRMRLQTKTKETYRSRKNWIQAQYFRYNMFSEIANTLDTDVISIYTLLAH